MNRLFNFSAFMLLILLLTCQICNTSCGVTKIQHDTTLTVALLSANPWKFDEYIGVEGNRNVRYVRGAAENNVDYENHYIIFNSDFTGGLYDPNFNYLNPLTWSFTDSSNTKIVMTINFPTGPVTVTWNHIFYKNRSLVYDQSWTQNGINAHLQIVQTPK
jgi:hypothetical protein